MGDRRKIVIFVLAFFAISFLYLGVYFMENEIILDAPGVTGRATSDTVNLSVTVGNRAPVLSAIDAIVLACEGSTLSYLFNATDIDGDSLEFDTNQGSPIFVGRNSQSTNSSGALTAFGEIHYSVALNKSQVGTYDTAISVKEEADVSSVDTGYTNITVIEINNAPDLTSIPDQGATIDFAFAYQVNVSDIEDGNQTSGNLSFNVSFSDSTLFSIGSTGAISFTPTSAQAGSHTVSVCVTDLNLSSYHQNISVCGAGVATNRSACDSFTLTISAAGDDEDSGGGGGSGGGSSTGVACAIEWACLDWDNCANLEVSLGEGSIAGEDYRMFLSICESNGWSEEFCGYQIRDCSDLNSCGRDSEMPLETRECYYTSDPSCSDGIKNCHDGACEFLVDCGGTCGACATCDDGVMNQGENGVDCSGPCAKQCDVPLSPPRLFDELTLTDFVLISSVVGAIVLSIWLYHFLSVRSVARGVKKRKGK